MTCMKAAQRPFSEAAGEGKCFGTICGRVGEGGITLPCGKGCIGLRVHNKALDTLLDGEIRTAT